MHQVRGRVIAPRGIALFHIDFSRDGIADFQSSAFNLDPVDNQALNRRISISNNRTQISTTQLADIADLATALSIKRSLIQDNLTFAALRQGFSLMVALDQRQNSRFINSRSVVAFELRSCEVAAYSS